MKIRLICVGSLKESYWRDAFKEYAKRLGGYCQFECVEIPDVACKEKASVKEIEDVKDKEGAKILSKLGKGDYLIAMDLRGKTYDSLALAQHIEEKMVASGSFLSFVIGGSMGLSKEVMARANESISFGPGTFPHQLARIMLLEQLYRSFKILAHEPYHK